MEALEENFAALAERLADRYILFGEWLYARHSIHYRQLPHYFFESVPPGEYFVAAYAATNDPLPAVDLQSRLNALSRVATRTVIPSRKHVSLDLPLVVPRW